MPQGHTLVPGLADDPPSFTEHFLLHYLVHFVPLCLLFTRAPRAAQPRCATGTMHSTPQLSVSYRFSPWDCTCYCHCLEFLPALQRAALGYLTQRLLSHIPFANISQSLALQSANGYHKGPCFLSSMGFLQDSRPLYR